MFYAGLRSGGSGWTVRRLLIGLIAGLMVGNMAYAGFRLPAEVMEKLPHPWPPFGWTTTLDLPDETQTQPHASEPRAWEGYFGQTLYRQNAGTAQYWTANVLIQDRGDSGAAWRAVSVVRCKSRSFRGYRARECSRGSGRYVTKTLHYEVGRFYVTIQVSGSGDVEYPMFDVGAMNPMTAPSIPLPRAAGGRSGR